MEYKDGPDWEKATLSKTKLTTRSTLYDLGCHHCAFVSVRFPNLHHSLSGQCWSRKCDVSSGRLLFKLP
jgi:hypothetical protein